MAYPAKTDKEAILAAAIKLVEEQGVGQLAIRSVATMLGLAPNALYRYFENLAALRSALADESRRRLLQAMQKASGRRGPAEAIRAVAQSYLTFARDNPEVFSLVLEPSGDDAAEDSTHAQNWRFVLDLVGRLYGEKRAPEAATTIWAFLHGMTELHKIGAFGKEKPLSSIKFGLQIWIDAAK